MPICPNGGSQIPDESVFFQDFEKTIVLEATSQPPPYVTLEKPKLSSLKLGAVAIIMLLVGVGIGYNIQSSPPHIDKRRFCYG